MSFTLQSRIPQIIAKATQGERAVNEASAQHIAQAAQAGAARDTGEGAGSIEAKPSEGNDFNVIVGAWWMMFTEWGTSKQGARPFLTPAAEAEREAHRKAIADLYS